MQIEDVCKLSTLVGRLSVTNQTSFEQIVKEETLMSVTMYVLLSK